MTHMPNNLPHSPKLETAKREPEINNLMHRLHELTDTASRTADRVVARLDRVCRPEPFVEMLVEKEVVPVPPQELPQLLHDMRMDIENMERYLSTINEILDRCEI